jgi:hypothetical protein
MAFGIDTTRGPDSDQDRVLDGTDNCLLVENANQRDRDGDGFGDVCDPCVDGPQIAVDDDGDGVDDGCDPCLAGSNHDEDGDGTLDGCDVCPADVDDQADSDSDGVGDVCDHAPGIVNARVMFDAFAPPRADWKTGFQDWANPAGESYMPVPPINGKWLGAWTLASKVPSFAWSMRTHVVLPAPGDRAIGREVGIEAISPTGGLTGRLCGLTWEATGWTVAPGGQPYVVGDEVTLELRERMAPGVTSECFIDGVLASTRTYAGPIPDHIMLLRAAAGADYRWADIVR